MDKESGVQSLTPIIFEKMESIVANIILPMYFTSWYEANISSSSCYFRFFDTNNRLQPIEINIINHNLQVNNSFKFGKGVTANLAGRNLSSFISGDQFQNIGININLGISKKLSNGSIGFNIQDMTNKSEKIFWE